MRLIAPLPAIAAIFTLAACTNSGANYVPVIDGAAGPTYAADLNACQALAASSDGTGRVAGTAAAGGAVAGASSVIWNDNSDNLDEAVGVGILAGLTAGAIQQNQRREEIVKRCMAGRGYKVIG